MLTEALELISDRREVLIVTDNERHANHLRMAIDEIACKCGLLSKPSESHLLSFISPSTPHFDWQRLHLIGKSRHTTVLVDHYTIEARFAPMLKMLHRYDNPLP